MAKALGKGLKKESSCATRSPERKVKTLTRVAKEPRVALVISVKRRALCKRLLEEGQPG